MTASERLRELGKAVDEMQVSDSDRLWLDLQPEIVALRNALPLIADCVQRLEVITEEMWTVQDGDGPQYVSARGLEFLTQQLQKSGVSLTALRDVLEEK